MDPKELAARLERREYRDEIDRATEHAAKLHGLVVVFGASDDLMEFRGAINDEIGCWGGGTVSVDAEGLLPDFEELRRDRDKEALRDYFRREPGAWEIRAVWEQAGYAWVYETAIPHATFEIREDGEPYCRGIVFRLADASSTPRGPDMLRIELDLSEAAHARLKALQDKVQASSAAEVIRDALKLYDGIVDEGGPNARVVVERPDGTTAIVRLFE